MRIGSLFSGIGGLELGLERATGGRTIWQVEQDEYARAVLAKHWPNVRRYEDVRQVGAHNLEPVDLICGGFPCQDISLAGKGAGLDGARSGLWTEYARIVREYRDSGRPPRFVVVENVPALLGRGMGRVLGDLAACGYDAIWDCIPAAAVGAHHRRDRIFIVAWRISDTASGSQSRRNSEQRRCGTPAQISKPWNDDLFGSAYPFTWSSTPQKSVGMEAGRPKRTYTKTRPALFRRRLWRWPEPNVDRVVDGIPARVDRLRCLGNAVVPQVAEVVGQLVMEINNDLA